jgi:CoA:oxalate CoA-transferase
MSASAGEPAGGPLAGVRVLDLTTFLSGPFCTQILADLGAHVTKLESPDGDSSRHIPPHFVGDDSAYFLAHNRGKRSIVVDLKMPAGQEIARTLVAQADVVIDNFRPGVAARLGLDPEQLRQAHPALVWVSISGFGQRGPRRDQPAYDIIVQALSGVMSLTGVPDAPAMRLGIPAGDLVAGMYAVMAALAALLERERTGLGKWADISMLDGQLSMLSYQALYATVGGVTPRPQGSRHDSIPTYRSFMAGDGRELVVAANTHRMWLALCDVLDLPALTEDPRFTSGSTRLANEHELGGLLEKAFLQRDAAAWVDALVEAAVPAALIRTVPEALADARFGEREMSLSLVAEDGSVIETVATPIRYVAEARLTSSYPPRLGQQTAVVLAEIGCSTSDQQRLAAQGVVEVDPRTSA